MSSANTPLLAALAWPLLLLLAWLTGESVARRFGLPRLMVYGLFGLLAGPAQLGLLPPAEGLSLIAPMAFGLLLFEFGYRINLRWYLHNPWLSASALCDALIGFLVLDGLARVLGADDQTARLLGAVGMASAPATLLRVLNETHASGQIAERLLHVSALGCVLALLAFKATLAIDLFERSGSLMQALGQGSAGLLASAALGLLAGAGVAGLLRLPRKAPEATLPFALTVLALVAIGHALRLSPILAALACGLAARHHRVVLSHSARGFGPLGELLSLALFVWLGSRLDLHYATQGLLLGAALVLARLALKPLTMLLFAQPSGTTLRKGALLGLGLAPFPAFMLLLLEPVPAYDLMTRYPALAAATALLEILGPLACWLALHWGGELPRGERR